MSARLIARRVCTTIAGTTVIGGVSLTLYSNTENGLGFQREVRFWSDTGPVLFDYWWNSFTSSPKVKLRTVIGNAMRSSLSDITEIEGAEQNATFEQRIKVDLHERNAPRIFNSMLSLGGLYIKLGQVLSVTALPIPEQYRILFRTLQSNVPNSSDFDSVVRPTLESELGVTDLNEIFEYIDTTPIGAASIGQAHRAILKSTGEEVVVKVQYPEAKWQVPADVKCVGDFLSVCVFFGVVDEGSARMSYDEFARQFTSELDYQREAENLRTVYQSSLDPKAPYIRRGVVVPQPYDELCTDRVITMTYLPGPKFEEESKRVLESLGINTKKGIRQVVMEAHDRTTETNVEYNATEERGGEVGANASSPIQLSSYSWKRDLINRFVSVNTVLSFVRFARRISLWSTSIVVRFVQSSPSVFVSNDWKTWANERHIAILQAERWGWTQEAITALFDVHGYQILNQGLFNADPHPGNLLIVQDEKSPSKWPKIGLIDFGQVKQLTNHERVRVAKLILSIANKESDDDIANHFRNLGIKTKNDSTRFLAEFGRLMFGSFETKHLNHDWHRELHKEDRVLYFPNELSMVYRTALLLRGLAMSLQFNPSVGEEWRYHAQETIKSEAATSTM
jgi:aarF domain-containing kinase